MGGEGSMMSMIQTLRNNKKMMSKRKDKKSFEGSYANVTMREFPKASPEQLKMIRQRMQLENKKRLKIQIVFLLTIVTLMTFLVLKFL